MRGRAPSSRQCFALLLLCSPALSASRDAGILYEVWHTHAAQAMGRVAAVGAAQLTTELVIQSAGALTLDDVYAPLNQSFDIYNAQPALGFYCLYRARPGQPPPVPDCANISATARAHADRLTAGGFDYVAVDVTNWPMADVGGSTDVAVLRPTEVLFEEWAALRAAGVATPAIAVWPCSPAGSTTWQYLLDTLYNDPRYAGLVYVQGGKKVVFVPHAGANCWDPATAALIEANGGRNDVKVIPMWALFGDGGGAAWQQGVWGFFSPCTDAAGDFTTSMFGGGVGACNQFATQDNATGPVVEISASGGYMLSQCALPWASPGHLRGLTVARLFERVLAQSPPHLFMSSFNEFIGGRQAPASGAKIAFNMGLPVDPQRAQVWVDTYAAEFSRDIEPTVEAGDATWLVAASCVALYKAAQTCADAPDAPCCTRADKDIFVAIWSLRRADGGDALLTALVGERDALVAGKAWAERCSPIANPTAFCVDGAEPDGRDGPFALYARADVADGRGGATATAPLFRCMNATANAHFFSADEGCEGATTESTLGWMAAAPGLEMLRALRRCRSAAGARMHALDLACDDPDPAAPGVLGYVR